jgi:hypothetical protein
LRRSLGPTFAAVDDVLARDKRIRLRARLLEDVLEDILALTLGRRR